MSETRLRAQAISAGTPDQVWSVVSDVERWPEFLDTFSAVRRLDGPGSVREGSRFEVRQPGLAKAVYEIIDWQPGRGLTWVSRTAAVTTTADHRVSPDEGGSRLELSLDWTGPLALPVRLLLGGKGQRMINLEAETFARLAGQG